MMDPTETPPGEKVMDKEKEETEKEEAIEQAYSNSDFEFDTDCEDDEMTLAPELEGLEEESTSLDSFPPSPINWPTSNSKLSIATNLELEEIINTLREPRAGSSKAAAAAAFVLKDWPEGKLHPLMIREVLAVVFGGLDVRSLQSCRLVATIWNEEACRTLQEKWPATFVGDKSLSRYMAIYCHFADVDRPYPHAVYEFYGVNFSANNEALDELFKNYGYRMKSLVLQISGILFEKLKSVLLNDLKNLESLWLRTLPIGPDDHQVRIRTRRKFRGLRKRRWETTFASKTIGDSWYYDVEDNENESSNSGEEGKSGGTVGLTLKGMSNEPYPLHMPSREFIDSFNVIGDSFMRTRLRAQAQALQSIRERLSEQLEDKESEKDEESDTEGETDPWKVVEEKKMITENDEPVASTSAAADAATATATRDGEDICLVNSQVRHLAIGTKDLCTMLNYRPAKSTLAADYERRYGKLIALFELLPNLTRVAISGQDRAIDSIHSRTMTRSMIKMPPDSFRALTDIHFPLLMDDIFLQGLIDLNCTFLNDLELIFFKSVQPDLLTQFFTKIARSLNKLSLSFASSFHYPYSRKPLFGQKFHRMKELTLRRFRWDLRFLEFMPLLEKLIFKDMSLSEIFPISLQTLENMKVFRCEDENHSPRRIDSEVLSRVCRAFPNLTELHIYGANDDCLGLLYCNLPYLTKLELMGGTFTDSGITGVTMDVCQDLTETLSYDNVDGDRLRKNLFIGNLTRIEVLKLESNQIGEMSVICGINKCQRLKSLYLKSSRINDRSIRKIAEVLAFSDSLVCLDVTDCGGITPAGMGNLKVALSGRKISISPRPGIEDLAYQVSIRHRRLDRLERGRLLRDDDPRSGTPALARTITFACRPLPRSYAHRPLLTLDEYEEIEIDDEERVQAHMGQMGMDLPDDGGFGPLPLPLPGMLPAIGVGLPHPPPMHHFGFVDNPNQPPFLNQFLNQLEDDNEEVEEGMPDLVEANADDDGWNN